MKDLGTSFSCSYNSGEAGYLNISDEEVAPQRNYIFIKVIGLVNGVVGHGNADR